MPVEAAGGSEPVVGRRWSSQLDGIVTERYCPPLSSTSTPCQVTVSTLQAYVAPGRTAQPVTETFGSLAVRTLVMRSPTSCPG